MSETLPVGDPNCPHGGTKFTAANGVSYACNGAPGSGNPGQGPGLRVLRANLFMSSTSCGPISGEGGESWIASAVRSGDPPQATLCTLNFVPGTFAERPSCLCSVMNGGATCNVADPVSLTASFVRLQPNQFGQISVICAAARPSVCGETADSAVASCAQVKAECPEAPSSTRWIVRSGGSPFQVWCEQEISDGGWTKVLFFPFTRSLTTAAVTADALGGSFTGTGKLADATINQLMTGNEEMLAVLPGDPTRWLVVTWGSDWTFDETRRSGTRGGFCQDMIGGGPMRRFNGTSDFATYRDSANAFSSYCWKFGWTTGGDGGIDLQNDGNGESNASTFGVAQQPFVMFVR